jgi:hypothetical protein
VATLVAENENENMVMRMVWSGRVFFWREPGDLLSVGAFLGNLAAVATKTFSHLICFITSKTEETMMACLEVYDDDDDDLLYEGI